MDRRGFLGAILATGVAPTFAHSKILMPVKRILLPERIVLWGDGTHDDAPAFQAYVDGKPVYSPDGIAIAKDGVMILPPGNFVIGKTIQVPRNQAINIKGAGGDKSVITLKTDLGFMVV